MTSNKLDMTSLEAVEQSLRDSLPHLYSPTYQPPELLRTITNTNPQQGTEAVQTALIHSIDTLKPTPDVPPNARIRRLYDVLSYRYLQGLTQKETAKRLGITARHLRREQNEAVHLLAQRLLEQRSSSQSLQNQPPGNTPLPRDAPERSVIDKTVSALPHSMLPNSRVPNTEISSEAWRSQVRQELAILRQGTPGATANIGDIMPGAVKSGQTLAANYRVTVKIESVQPDLLTTVHPSVLREVLITTIEKIVRHMDSGEINLTAAQVGNQINITIVGYPTTAQTPPHSDFIEEALAVQGGSVGAYLDEDSVMYVLTLPVADQVKVAVIEDNADLVHFFKHYTTKTRYKIVHIDEAANIVENIVETAPDIIVIDIMLPDIDGWELLSQLHTHPFTRTTPIIICSVVRREELALAHGAALYLQKPVRRQQFIQALDQVLNPT